MTRYDDDFVTFVEGKKEDFQSHKQRKEKQPIAGSYDSLYDELKQKCNPANFMEPYDNKKIDVANEIYKQLESFQEDSQLKELRHKAINYLEVKFSTEKLYYYLCGVCYPKNFMNEYYDAQLLASANNIYNEIKENADDIEVLEDCESKAKDLICIIESRREIEAKKKAEEIATQKKIMQEMKEKQEIEEKYSTLGGQCDGWLSVFVITSLFFIVGIAMATDKKIAFIALGFFIPIALFLAYKYTSVYKEKKEYKQQHKNILDI